MSRVVRLALFNLGILETVDAKSTETFSFFSKFPRISSSEGFETLETAEEKEVDLLGTLRLGLLDDLSELRDETLSVEDRSTDRETDL